VPKCLIDQCGKYVLWMTFGYSVLIYSISFMVWLAQYFVTKFISVFCAGLERLPETGWRSNLCRCSQRTEESRVWNCWLELSAQHCHCLCVRCKTKMSLVQINKLVVVMLGCNEASSFGSEFLWRTFSQRVLNISHHRHWFCLTIWQSAANVCMSVHAAM